MTTCRLAIGCTCGTAHSKQGGLGPWADRYVQAYSQWPTQLFIHNCYLKNHKLWPVHCLTAPITPHSTAHAPRQLPIAEKVWASHSSEKNRYQCCRFPLQTAACFVIHVVHDQKDLHSPGNPCIPCSLIRYISKAE